MAESRAPQEINHRNWYYEEERGIRLIHEVVNAEGSFVQTDEVVIPWAMIERSRKRRSRQ